VYQHQLSVLSLRGRLMSISESWGVNGLTTRYAGPVSVVLRLRLVSCWGLWNRDQRRPMCLKGRERILLFYRILTPDHLYYCVVCQSSAGAVFSHTLQSMVSVVTSVKPLSLLCPRPVVKLSN